MPDTHKPSAAKAPESPPVPLANPAASTDPAIQHLCAQRNIHAMSGNADAADAVSAQLRALGYA